MRIQDKTYRESELEEQLDSYQVKEPEHIVKEDIYQRIGNYELEADVYALKHQEMANYLQNQMKEIER